MRLLFEGGQRSRQSGSELNQSARRVAASARCPSYNEQPMVVRALLESTRCLELGGRAFRCGDSFPCCFFFLGRFGKVNVEVLPYW